MPIQDKPLPPIQNKAEDFLAPGNRSDMLALLREATYSPSPLTRILNDPTLLPSGSTENLSRPHRRRDHRAPYVAAIAIAEEERESKRLKTLLRASGDHLEYEMRRAEDAIARASFSERQEREGLARARAAEEAQERLSIESTRLERDTRSYQIQLEASQRETRRLQDEMDDIRREMEQLRYSEAKAQESSQRYQLSLRDFQKRAAGIQGIVDKCYEDGRQYGYDEGYDIGYDDGHKAGLKKGRKEGVKEGREQGRNEERRNAIEAFDQFLSKDANDSQSASARRWAQSIYMTDGYAESLGPMDSGSVV